MNDFDAKTLGQSALETVRSLLSRREAILTEIANIDAELSLAKSLLGENGDEFDLPELAPIRKREKVKLPSRSKKSKLPVRVVAENQKPIKQWVKEIFSKAGRVPMGESEVTMSLITEGYASDKDDDDLLIHVYNDAINPLLRDGSIESVGERPHRKYRFVK